MHICVILYNFYHHVALLKHVKILSHPDHPIQKNVWLNKQLDWELDEAKHLQLQKRFAFIQTFFLNYIIEGCWTLL